MAYKDPLDPRAREARRKHYHANKQQYIDRSRRQREEMRTWLSELKESTPCMDCGVSYPACVMDFDHRDPSQKADNVGRVLATGAWRKLKAEIAKCDLVCSNCHRIRTHMGEAEVAGWSPKPPTRAFDSFRPCS